MKYFANIITIARLIAAPMLLFTEPLLPPFYALFLFCGITDMLDGAVARKTHSESKLGAVLDSIADIVFVIVCLITLLPMITFPFFLWIWIGIIALIRVINLVSGYLYHLKLVMLHTYANKATGLLLFLLPFTLGFVRIDYPAVLVCIMATFAAIQEGYLIQTNRIE
ncbi:MAG: CDP-alcohol phosphatidyltransferase family protein [Butyricicoccus sp.]